MDSLIPKYKDLAKVADKNFQGLSILNHAKSIGDLAKSIGAVTMLDFGCGRGDAYKFPHKVHAQFGIKTANVTLYDPAFRKDAQLPVGKFDLVVCSDVLEHVPEEEVDEFIARLFEYAGKAVWASVCCRPASKFFPTGENLHVTVKPYAWWHERFVKASVWPIGPSYQLVETP